MLSIKQVKTAKEEAELNWLDAVLRVEDAEKAVLAAQRDLENRKREFDEAYKIYRQVFQLAEHQS